MTQSSLWLLLIDAFFPATCPLCERRFRRGNGDRYLACSECRGELARAQPSHRCAVCSIPIPRYIDVCRRCRNHEFAFDVHVAAHQYEGAPARMVQAYKFSCVRPLHRLIAEQLASAQPNEWARLPLVPIPTTHRSFVRRGFRTVPLLCRSLSRITGQPVLRLLRARNALPQKSLTYEERCLNAQAALRRRRRIGKVPREAVLVDDVFTTGATSSAAARILRESGVERVVVLTVAMEY